ncbi:MAG: NAD-dependent protein deacylase [candidate division Zixibacteria bacterium SM23_81]|nr:MAG: NAD-dependent protein deacylase [candidate division Zixibacteria bacterium SM23_81]
MTENSLFSNEFLRKMKSAKSVAVLTGAGISAESGVPTFRGEEGLWKKFKPEELATVDAFLSNPKLVWEWYRHRRQILKEVKPNAGHLALRDLEEKFEKFTLITQNIDGLHQRAGSRRVVELHGNIRRNRCQNCGRIYQDVSLEEREKPPTCTCHGLLRPDVVWFGESLPPEAIDQAFYAAAHCDVFLSVGTSAVVYPAAYLPLIALQYLAYVVEFNIEPTAISHQVSEFIQGKTGQVLPQLVKMMGPGTS